MLFLDFLKETGLIKSECICHKCNSPMKFAAKNSISDGYSGVCRKLTDNKVCGTTKTIRRGSWFTCIKLRHEEIFMHTFEIISGSATSEIRGTYSFSAATLADWCQFINEYFFKPGNIKILTISMHELELMVFYKGSRILLENSSDPSSGELHHQIKSFIG
ncbi:DDE_Tnp_IS1595 domain-containing protein [Nephila pilipes]|uniref:DDE_Tnp_IS1595 domain-containing protein n=1 Tax=Nephila pilipes TaxID=299642 RepID=A0A8X6JZR2_NEPPI|nr:DDE_Tnp_IS1595 domain-containing protein [Nephila pilipes]